MPRLADNGDLEHDLYALLEQIGYAARKAGTAVVPFVDEMQYVAQRELAALIMALHRCAQRRLPVIPVGAGLPFDRLTSGEKRYPRAMASWDPGLTGQETSPRN